ncbi:MAG: site-2 protease family protein [Gammaproteobacteria bacterium]|nr:site-2 protease family protein [Gammaproteobacteria bacterium]
MAEMSLIQTLVVWTPPVLLAVTLHEVAHGWVARELGDDTAEALGRLSFNPLKHVDPVGTVLVPGLLYVLAGIVFGWAKPVPVNWDKLRNPRRDMALVAVAGPLANVVMLLAWAAVAKFGLSYGQDYFVTPGLAGIMINAVLIALNLLPVPPLDGSRVVSALLPHDLALQYGRIEPYGLIILLVLIGSGALNRLMEPTMRLIGWVMQTLLGG